MFTKENNLKLHFAKFFGVDINAKGNIHVPCPLHNDLNPSASLNLEKGVFQCFAKCGGYSLAKLAKKLEEEKTKTNRDKEEMQEQIIDLEVPATKDNYLRFIKKRKISEKTLQEVGAIPMFKGDLSGRLVFPYSNGNGSHYVARSFTNQKPKVLNSSGEKGLYGFQKGIEEFFLVEGIFDLLSLRELGYKNVVCGLGSSLSEHQAYLLRNSTVYILFDPDYSGWAGSIKTSKMLSEIGANPIILTPPHDEKDINDLYQVAPERKNLKNYLEQSMSKYTATDVVYVDRLFTGKDRKLNMIKTGLHKFDYALGGEDGGWVEGLNTVWAETGNAKSFFCLFMSLLFAQKGKRVLYNTTEISIRQCWARMCSHFSRHSWQELEKHPERLEKNLVPIIKQLAAQIKVVAGWKMAEIKRVSKNYDIIIIDYIQRMPGLTDQDMTNINMNLSALSDIARDEYKIIIVVSSIGRANYDNTNSISAGKGSGNIEFMSQTVSRVSKLDSTQVEFRVLKNTRYTPDQAVMFRVDLSNLNFKC